MHAPGIFFTVSRPYFSISDKEAPTIGTCPTSRSSRGHVVVTWQNPAATDNSGQVPGVNCSPSSGSNFTLGDTSVTCTATDGSGNTDTCSFNINTRCKFYDPSLIY